MNKFGTLFTVQIFGESHGACVGITIDGCPAGLPLSAADFTEDMERRKGGKQKGTTPRQEDDIPIFKAGLFNDITTGAPIMMLFENNNTIFKLKNICKYFFLIINKMTILNKNV